MNMNYKELYTYEPNPEYYEVGDTIRCTRNNGNTIEIHECFKYLDIIDGVVKYWKYIGTEINKEINKTLLLLSI